MPLDTKSEELQGVSKVPTFEKLTLTRGADGQLSIDGTFRIALRDAEGKDLADQRPAQFGFSHDELQAIPDFAHAYKVILHIAYLGLAQTNPSLVIESEGEVLNPK